MPLIRTKILRQLLKLFHAHPLHELSRTMQLTLSYNLTIKGLGLGKIQKKQI
jgi:hypothetical protein